jgi:hypothetical protein
MGGAYIYSRRERLEMHTKFLSEYLKRRDRLEDLEHRSHSLASLQQEDHKVELSLCLTL